MQLAFDPFVPSAPSAPDTAPEAGDLVREAEAQQALAELFPHLKLDALRAIQELFPLRAKAQMPRMH